ERPERPTPSGRVSPQTALRVAGGLTAAGLTLPALAGRRARAVAVPLAGTAWLYDIAAQPAPRAPVVMAAARPLHALLGGAAAPPLAGTVWLYDMAAKPTPLGPVVMAAARTLDVLLGGSAAPRRALPAALALGAHTSSVTALSRGEVHGSSPGVAGAALATTAGVAATVAGSALRPGRPRSRVARLASVALAGSYAYSVGRAQAEAVRTPDAPTVRRATGTGIRGMVPLQAALVARGGKATLAAVLMAAVPAIRAAAKRISPT